MMGIDYDLALCGVNTDCEEDCFQCLLHSASMDDINEGFDGLLPAELADAGLYAFKAEGATGCGGTEKQTANFALKYWLP